MKVLIKLLNLIGLFTKSQYDDRICIHDWIISDSDPCSILKSSAHCVKCGEWRKEYKSMYEQGKIK